MSLAKEIARKLLAAATSPGVACAVGQFWYFFSGKKAYRALSMADCRAILIVRTDEIGDVVLTTPFLRELRRNNPSAWVTLVVKPQVLNLVEFCPYVDEVVPFDWRTPSSARRLRIHVRALRIAATQLWKRRFDIALMPRNGRDYYHSKFLGYFSGAARRVGYCEPLPLDEVPLELGLDRLLTESLVPCAGMHQADCNLDVLRFMGGKVSDARLEVWLGEEDRIFARKMCAEAGNGSDGLLVAIAPGAGAKKRCWPIERYSELCRALHRDFGARLLVVGGLEDRRLGGELQSALGAVVRNFAGLATLRQTIAVLERCQLTISSDSGPMHMAAAAGSPVVEISCHPRTGDINHFNSPALFHPWGVPHVVVQPEYATSPCRDSCDAAEPHCILGVETRRVLEGAHSLVSVGPRADQDVRVEG